MATVTAAQKRAQAKVEYDAFLAACPSRKLLDRISDKWVTLILAALGSDGSHQLRDNCAGEPRAMRYSELSRLLAGVSQKMLLMFAPTHRSPGSRTGGGVLRGATPARDASREPEWQNREPWLGGTAGFPRPCNAYPLTASRMALRPLLVPSPTPRPHFGHALA